MTLPAAGNMFPPNSTGVNNSSYFETAALSGVIQGTGADVTLTFSSDDDSLVYLHGNYFGGAPNVHPKNNPVTLDFGDLSGNNSLKIFYADRAQSQAYLFVDVEGANVVGTPELSTWAMLGLGFAELGLAGHRARKMARFAV